MRCLESGPTCTDSTAGLCFTQGTQSTFIFLAKSSLLAKEALWGQCAALPGAAGFAPWGDGFLRGGGGEGLLAGVSLEEPSLAWAATAGKWDVRLILADK